MSVHTLYFSYTSFSYAYASNSAMGQTIPEMIHWSIITKYFTFKQKLNFIGTACEHLATYRPNLATTAAYELCNRDVPFL